MSALLNRLHLSEVTRKRELAILIVLGLMESFSWTLVKPMLPLFATSLGAKEMLIGIIVAVPPLIQIFTRIPSGAAAARYGKRRMIILSFIATTAGAAVLTLTRSVALIFPAQVVLAFGESMFWPANWAYVTSLAPRNKQGTIVGITMGLQGIIGLLMPYLGGVIFDRFGFWLNGLIYTAAGITGLLMSLQLPVIEPVGVTPAAERTVYPAPATTGAPGAVGAVPAPAAAKRVSTVAAEATPGAKPRGGSIAGARALLARRKVLLAALSGSIVFFSWGIGGAFYSIYVKEYLGFTATHVGLLMTWQSAFNTVARLVFSQIAPRIRIDQTLFGVGLANVVPLMALPWIRTMPGLMALGAVTGAASGVVPISIKTLYANATNDKERTLAMGIDGVSMNLGSLTSPLIAGVAAQAIGIPATFFFGNLVAVAALFAARRLVESRRFVRTISGRDAEPMLAEEMDEELVPGKAAGTVASGRS